jgi:hypothetical protein
MDLELQFEHRGSPGVIYATVRPNEDPTRWGYTQQYFRSDLWLATGFPVCQARVKHPAERFGRLMGWVQVICSGPPSHLTGEFDPWATFNGLDPPELFDSPWRSDRPVGLNWEAAISCA